MYVLLVSVTTFNITHHEAEKYSSRNCLLCKSSLVDSNDPFFVSNEGPNRFSASDDNMTEYE